MTRAELPGTGEQNKFKQTVLQPVANTSTQTMTSNLNMNVPID